MALLEPTPSLTLGDSRFWFANSSEAMKVNTGGVFYSCLGHREGAYNPCPKWARTYRLMTESGSKAFPASRAPEV